MEKYKIIIQNEADVPFDIIWQTVSDYMLGNIENIVRNSHNFDITIDGHKDTKKRHKIYFEFTGNRK